MSYPFQSKFNILHKYHLVVWKDFGMQFMIQTMLMKLMIILDESRQSGAFPCHLGGETAGCHMISGAGLCWQHVGGVGSTTTTT